MTLVPWEPEPFPFGNATGFDRVSLDVKVQIAERLGMKVTRGKFPDDIQAEQEEMTHEKGEQPLKEITISADGLTISGDYSSGRSIRGYRSSRWLGQMTPHTVVFDFRSVPFEIASKIAIRGPMIDVDLPDGMVSKLGPIDPLMVPVAEAYMNFAGTSLAEVGAEIEDWSPR